MSGIIFASLYFCSLAIIRIAIPADPTEPGTWLTDPSSSRRVRYALNVIPFTGIAFLWFMGVVRTRIGAREDRFFATVYLGSGLLFVAMVFVAAAASQGLLATFVAGGIRPAPSDAYAVSRALVHALMNFYAVKMAAVFVIVTSTIGLRTSFLPRWVVYAGYAIALAMLLTIADFAWIALLFPAWVLLLSAYILVTDIYSGSSGANRA